MLNRLKSLISPKSPRQTPGPLVDGRVLSEPALAPDRAFLAVGDVHGCLDPLDALLAKLDAPRAEGAALVFLGDLVDRGPDSRGVLLRVRDLLAAAPEDTACLIGNHELMMLDFIDDPLGRGNRWLAFGGAETLQSFGLAPVSHKGKEDAILDAADALEDALDREGLQTWLRGLPDRWSSGNLVCVHAAMDPERPLADQSRRHLCWGHRDFPHVAREDGVWVVHGHAISSEPLCEQGRIAVDTGAYQSGRLTAAEVRAGQCRFLQV